MAPESPIFIKICGLRDVASAQAAVDAGADALGFILAPSKRQVTPRDVADIHRSLVARRERLPTTVGVIVDANPDEIAEIVRVAGVDAIQLSGNEDVSILDQIEIPAMKVLRFPGGTALDDALAEVDRWYTAERPVVRVIVEGHAEGSYGGTGTVADWGFVREIALRYPIVLAGGLTPDNVAEAIASVGPQGVDVSSGIETDGVKDPEKIQAFVRNARSAPFHSSIGSID